MNLASVPLSDIGPAWRSRIAALPAEDRERLLGEADALYRGDRDDRRRALSCWLALRESLDPARAADRPRLLALLIGVPPGIEDLVPLARRAEADGGEDLRSPASIFLGRVDADEGRLGAAEERFRSALARERGRGGEGEYFAASSLATLWHRGNREFEALVLSRRLLRLSERLGEETRIRFARMMVAGALANLGEWDLLAEAVGTIDRSLEGREPGHERTVRFYVRLFAARRALALGDLDLAAAETEAASAAELRGLSLEGERRTLLLLRARCAEAGGRPVEALRLVEEALGARGPRNVGALETLACLARLRFQGGDAAGGMAAARELLGLLEEDGTPVHGTGQVVEAAATLGRVLRSGAPGSAEAGRAWDAAARAVLQRIHEIDRCLRELPELSVIEPGDETILQRSRVRFVQEHRVLLDRVRVALSAGGRLPVFPREGPYLKVCAWCVRVLGEGAAWVPVAHFLPIGDGLPVTHGICPPCAERFGRT